MVVYKPPLFFVKTFIILGIQPIVAFCLSTIFYESEGTLGMVTMLDESLIMIEVPHNDFEANQKTIVKNQSCHSITTKLKDLPTHSAIDQVGVIFGVVVVCNEDGVFKLRRFLGKWN
jgi:predicted membrane protein